MSDDSRPKSHVIPPWQQKGHHEKQEPERQSSIDSDLETPRSDLKARAAKFLEEDEIRNASTDRKIEFLERKGLDHDEIQELLTAAGNAEEQQVAPPIVAKGETLEKTAHRLEDLPKFEQSHSPTTHPTSTISPPIITYPEFLLHSQKPSPLITAQRLLTTLYAISGFAALTYGASKYIAEPMIESLTSARHSLAETTIRNINDLNEKLESAVSVVPDTISPTTDSPAEDLDDAGAGAYFQRSTATQTSPNLSRSSSSISSNSPQKSSEIEVQSTRLQKVQEDLQELLKPALSVHSPSDLKKELDTLQTFLSHMEFGGALQSSGERNKEEGIAKLKAEIRQAKGVLLSSRNFPSSLAARGWGTTAS